MKFLRYIFFCFSLCIVSMLSEVDIFAFDYTSVQISSEGSYTSDNQYFPETYNIDDIPDAVIDNNGHYVRGSLWTSVNQSGIGTFNVILGNQFSGDNSTYFPNDNECMFVIHFNGSGSMQDEIWGNNLDGYYLCWKYIPNNSDSSYSRIMGYAMYGQQDERWRCYLRGQVQPNNIPVWLIAPIPQYWNISEGASMHTNLPIFEETSVNAIDNYISNGDISGATNKNDINPFPEVPYPVNLDFANSSKTQGGSDFTSPVVVSWSSSSNNDFTWQNMRFNVSYQIIYGTSVKVGASVQKSTHDTGLIQAAKNVKYTAENMDYTIGTQALNKSVSNSLYGLNVQYTNYWIDSVTVWVTNVDGNDFENVSASKYVGYDYFSKIEDSSNDPVSDDGSEGGQPSEDGSSGTGTSIGSENGKDSINFNGNIKNDYPKYNIWNGLNGALTGSGEVKNALNNAWGLFGTLSENGLIAILGECMPFVPQEIWNLFTLAITSGISFLICGALFRFLRG